MLNRLKLLTVLGGGGGPAYIINDQFLTDLAAGSVDESLATPGPGTRNVVDTGDFLSISGGEIVTTDATGTGDPCLFYKEPIARVAGRLGWGYLRTESRGYLGFGDGITGIPQVASFFGNSSTLNIYDGTVVSTGDWTSYQYQQTLVALRLAGGFYFVEYDSHLQLVYIGDADGTGDMYYGWSHRAAGSDTSKGKLFKVPEKLWLPTPIASDGMSASGATDGLGHAEGVAGGLGAGGSGVSWTAAVGTWGVAAGARSCSALDGGVGICTIPVTSADLYIDCELTRNGSELGSIARYTDANNYLVAYHDGTNAKLDEVVAGVPNTLITGAVAYSAGAVLALALSGQGAHLIYNKTGIGSTSSINAGLTAAVAGLYSTDTGNTFDDLRVYARGTSGEYDNFFP